MLDLDHIRIEKFHVIIYLSLRFGWANAIDTYSRLKIVLCGNFKLKCVFIEFFIQNSKQIYFVRI